MRGHLRQDPCDRLSTSCERSEVPGGGPLNVLLTLSSGVRGVAAACFQATDAVVVIDDMPP